MIEKFLLRNSEKTEKKQWVKPRTSANSELWLCQILYDKYRVYDSNIPVNISWINPSW